MLTFFSLLVWPGSSTPSGPAVTVVDAQIVAPVVDVVIVDPTPSVVILIPSE